MGFNTFRVVATSYIYIFQLIIARWLDVICEWIYKYLPVMHKKFSKTYLIIQSITSHKGMNIVYKSTIDFTGQPCGNLQPAVYLIKQDGAILRLPKH